MKHPVLIRDNRIDDSLSELGNSGRLFQGIFEGQLIFIGSPL
jgi:hypothetical protein